MFKEYVAELLEKHLVEETEEKGKKTYSVTNKGYKFLEEYKVILSFIDNFGL